MTCIYIATPSYNGSVLSNYAISLAHTLVTFTQNNINYILEIRNSSTLLPTERNILFENFYQSGASHMLCIDADIGWLASDVVKLLGHNKDIICGSYISRHEKDIYCLVPSSGTFELEQGLLQVDYVPMGFMLLSRLAISTMRDKLPQYKYTQPSIDFNVKTGFAFCDTEVRDGIHWGEDYTFCYRARQSGLTLWVDPSLKLNHHGKIGSLMEIL